MSTKYDCPDCGNEDILLKCVHAEYTCPECERDPLSIMLNGKCFLCMCEGEPDQLEFKAKDMFDIALDAALLGKKRRAIGLSPAILSEKAVWYVKTLHELFMVGFGEY